MSMLFTEVLVAVGLWRVFFLPGGLMAGLCLLLGRRRVRWFKWEHFLLVVPYLAWLLAYWVVALTHPRGVKHFTNYIGEPGLVGFVVAAVCTIHLLVGEHLNQKLMATVLFFAACMFAVAIACLLPCMDN
jgi:hypothetical protein